MNEDTTSIPDTKATVRNPNAAIIKGDAELRNRLQKSAQHILNELYKFEKDSTRNKIALYGASAQIVSRLFDIIEVTPDVMNHRNLDIDKTYPHDKHAIQVFLTFIQRSIALSPGDIIDQILNIIEEFKQNV